MCDRVSFISREEKVAKKGKIIVKNGFSLYLGRYPFDINKTR